MKKKVIRIIIAVLLVTAMTGITVFADDVNKITNDQKQAQTDLKNLQNQLAVLLSQMDDVQGKMADVTASMDQATVELKQAQDTQKQQYQDMKLRIKYMYEDQDASIMETLLTSNSMSDVLNKAEYMQKVYDYDRQKLDEMAVTSKTISDKKTQLTQQQDDLNVLQEDLTNKQALLYTTIGDKQKTVDNFPALLAAATEAASKKRAAEEAAAAVQAQAQSQAVFASYPAGDASVGQAVVSLAYQYIGTPYRSGGSDAGGFDCSGFTSFLYRQFGITLSRTTGGQMSGGIRIADISQALPGDIICYAGHVALYIGNGQIIHASVPGSTVKQASATGINLSIQSIRRYW